MSDRADRPYLGLRSFEEQHGDRFHGRDAAVAELHRRVKRGPLTELCGVSGIGKSSLLCAGLFPRLRAESCLPIYVRLAFGPDRPGWVAQIRAAVARELVAQQLEAPPPADDQPLRRYFVTVPLWSKRHRLLAAVLVLDQFEEIFTLGRGQASEVDALMAELGDLVAGDPAEVVGEQPLPAPRVVLSLREDYLGHLEDHRRRIPGLGTNRFRLTRMNGREALAAVAHPGPALISVETATRIVEFVAAGTAAPHDPVALATLELEPALLSLVCDELDRRRQELGQARITDELLKQQSGDIVERFYERSFHGLPDAVRKLVEEELITPDGYRTTVSRAAARALPGVTDEAITALIDRRLLRSETHLAAPHLELIHDLLVPLAKRGRERRVQQEQRARLRRESRHRRRVASAVITLLTLLAVALSSLVVYARRQARRAEREAIAARAQQAAAERQTRLLAENYLEQGRQALLDDDDPRRAISLLLAARTLTIERVALRVLFGQATRNLWTAQLRHDGPVGSVAFSPDGKWVATASGDKTARVWDMATGRPLAPPLRHEAEVVAVAFSPDGRLVVTAGADHRARVWGAAAGTAVGAPLAHDAEVVAAAFSPDGARVLTASRDRTARVWDVATGHHAITLRHAGVVNSAEFSPDGTRVVTASDDKNARVWNAATGETLLSIRHGAEVWSATFSPDGDRVVTASLDGTAKVLDLVRRVPPRTLNHGGVRSAAFSPDGSRIVTASAAKTARTWDVATGRMLASLEHGAGVVSAVFSPDGTRVATGSQDNTARIWDAATGAALTAPLRHDADVSSVRFGPDGQQIVAASADGTTRVWDVAAGREYTPRLVHGEAVAAAAFSPDGTRVVTAGDGLEVPTLPLWDKAAGSYSRPDREETVRVWDAHNGRRLTSPRGHDRAANSAGFSADGMWIVTASDDETARIWSASDGRGRTAPLVHDAAVNTAAFSPDGKWVVTASRDRTARIWDAATGDAVTPPLAHDGVVASAGFSPDGRWVVTASDDQTARIWDARGGGEPRRLAHDRPVNMAGFSPDGGRVVTASDDATARIWDVATGRALTLPLTHEDAVKFVAFSPDGAWAVTASWDKTARVWDAGTGRERARLVHDRVVNLARFSPGGDRVVTAAQNEARVWDAETGNALTPPLAHDALVVAIAFSPDGERVLTASVDGTARVWDVSPDSHSLEDWQTLAASHGAWTPGREPERTEAGVALARRFALEHRTAADELSRASNLVASAYGQLPRFPATARRFAQEAAALYRTLGRDEAADARTCLAIIAVLDHDLAAARAVLGDAAPADDAALVDHLAGVAERVTHRPALAAAIRAAAR